MSTPANLSSWIGVYWCVTWPERRDSLIITGLVAVTLIMIVIGNHLPIPLSFCSGFDKPTVAGIKLKTI